MLVTGSDTVFCLVLGSSFVFATHRRQRMVVLMMTRTTDRMRGDVMSVSMLTVTTATVMMLP